MNTRPPLGAFLFSLAFCLAVQASAATLPKWEPADEGWGAWNELMFTDSKGKPHDLWCHYKECGRNNATKSAALYILTRKSQEPYGNQAWRTTFSSKLSQFTFDATKERVIDPRDKAEYAVRFQSQLTAQGSVIKVLPPTSVANDASGGGQAPGAAALKAISFDPASVQGGAASKGWVSLKEAAPAAVAVALASNNPAASVPKTVTVAKGKKLASFAIKTTAVTEKKTARITAKLGASAQGANLTILPGSTTGQKPDVVQKPDEVQKPDVVQKPSDADLFSDTVEKAVARYLLEAMPEDQRKKEDEALRAAFAKSPEEPLVKQWQRKVLDKVNEQLTLEDHKPFLDKTGLTDPQLLAYICSRIPAPVVTETKPKAIDQAKKMKEDSGGALSTTDMDEAKAKADTFQPSPAVAGLCSKSKADAALKLPADSTGNLQTDLGRTGNVPSVVTGSKDGGGPGPKKEPLFNLSDEKDRRDAAAFGLLSGGIMGFLFMGAGAGPAGIFVGALIGGLVGFLGYAMKKKK